MKKSKSLLYSSGNLAASITAGVFSTYITFFYVDTLKMPASLIGIGMGIYGIWNAINDPLLGQMSDNTRSRWGRRIPYMLFGFIPFALIFTLVWTPPASFVGSQWKLFAYFMVMIFLYDTLYTLVIINWTSLFPEMYKTQQERTKVSGYRQIFGIAGNILGAALPPVLYMSIGWTYTGILFGVITLISLGLSILGAKEDPTYSEGKGLSLFQSLKATFSNKSFITYVVGAMFLQFTFVMLQGALPFYSKYVLGIDGGIKQSLILGTIFISALFFVTLWGKRANFKGSKNTLITAIVLYGLALIPFWFIKSFVGAMIVAALLGVGLSGLMILLDVFISDIADEDELRTGHRREGMYFGINGFMVRLGISAESVIMGFVLDKSGYDASLGIGAQPAQAIIGIKSLLTIVPIIALVFSVLFFSMYPLHGKRLEEVKERVAALHSHEE